MKKEKQRNRHGERDSGKGGKRAGKIEGEMKLRTEGKAQKGRHREEDTDTVWGSQRGKRRWGRGDIEKRGEKEEVGKQRGREDKNKKIWLGK